MATVSINLPTATSIHRGDKSKVGEIVWANIPENVLAALLPVAAKTVLLNTYNGGGSDRSDADRQAALDKKLAAWYRGELNVTGRGQSMDGLMFDAYRIELEAALGSMSDAKWAAFKLDTVGKEKGRVDFDEFIAKRAAALAKRDGEKRKAEDIATELTAKFEKAAEKLAAERADAAKALDTASIDF